jgi:hypothetical protein
MVRCSKHAPGVAQLSVFLRAQPGGAERQVMVNVESIPGQLAISCWARSKGEPVYHAWPGPHLEEGFFSPIETAILVAGTTEVAACCAGKTMDGDLSLRIVQTLAMVLSWVANGYTEEEKAAA